MIYIIFPTEAEFQPLLESLEGRTTVRIGRRAGVKGRLGGKAVTAVVSGVGQVNTAQTLTALLEDVQAELVIQGGCAGAYTGASVNVGDVAVATEEVFADLGVVTPDGWKGIEEIGLLPGAFPLEVRDMDRIKAESKRVHFGRFLTVSTISGTARRGEELYARFHALCENMEGAAAAQVARIYGVPFLEVRGISNLVVDRDRSSWDIAAASANCALLIKKILEI